MPEVSRRDVLATALAITGAGLVNTTLHAPAGALTPRRGHPPRIAIIGAGLAGLACADLLHRHGLRAEVFEARPDRIGGRCWSSRGWRDGQVAEHGGEFIDTRHSRMLGLARRFGLNVDDTFDADGGRPRLFLAGRRRHRSNFDGDMDRFNSRIVKLAKRIGPYDYRHASALARHFDEMTALDVVDRYMPGGSRSIAGRAFGCYLAGFLGLDLVDLGGLAVIDDRASAVRGADERYHVHGGNDQIVHGLAADLARGALTLDSPLSSVVRRADNRFSLRFTGSQRQLVVDAVVFALPFTTLRDVDLDGAGLSGRKRRCIDELGMGTNAKVILQFGHRPQCHGDWSGYLTTDRPYFQTWESSAGQRGDTGLITAYFGGRSGATGLPSGMVHGRAPAPTVDRVIAEMQRRGKTGLPGLRRDYLGRAQLDHWAEDPWTRGSYAAYLPGQYTRYAGFVGKPEHRMFFAGEHTSPLANQGYLEGAVRTGERAAREVLATFA